MSLPSNLFEQLGLHSTRPKIAKFPSSTSKFWCKWSWHNTDFFEVCDWSKHVCLVFKQISNQMDALGPYYTIATLFQKLCAWQILPIIYHNGPFYTSEILYQWLKQNKFHSLTRSKHCFKFLKLGNSLQTVTLTLWNWNRCDD